MDSTRNTRHIGPDHSFLKTRIRIEQYTSHIPESLYDLEVHALVQLALDKLLIKAARLP